MDKFILPELPYDFSALEPHIDAKTMEIHHDKHHATYVDKLNAALADQVQLQSESIEDLLRNLDGMPESIRTAVRNNGGGHFNHSLFWKLMIPGGNKLQDGALNDAISKLAGDLESFKQQFSEKATTLFGSGWTWLVKNSEGNLQIITTPNQDNPVMTGAGEPILGLDVWEHAYYLNYQNKRADYINAWWNIVNWDYVAELYSAK